VTAVATREVSIILPYFNGKQFISDTITSIVSQTFENFEALIIDDGSTNAEDSLYLKELINNHSDSRLRYLYKTNSGLSLTRNYGIELSIGTYIAFLDQDDIWAADKLEKQVQILKNYPDVDLVCTGAKNIGQKDGHMSFANRYKFLPGLVFDSYTQMLKANFVAASSACFRRSTALENAGSNNKFRICPDYELFLRFSRNTNFFYINEPLTTYRWHENNTVRNIKQMEVELIRVFVSAKIYKPRHALILILKIIISFRNLARISIVGLKA
jgi:glycosyltransferase involved in cell wall biosynthesis